MATTRTTERTAPNRSIKTRRIRFTFDEKSPARKHYVDGDIVTSHAISILSGSFPEGEEAFVRSVRRFSDQITDPELKRQVAGFIGQEMTHGREHRNLNDRLQEMGYPTKKVEKRMQRLAALERILPAKVTLAMTAAAEHGTATLAERVLSSDEIQRMAYDDEIRAMLNWHALEELEHKAVAFDVYRAVGGTESMRIIVMIALGLLSVGQLVPSVVMSILADREARDPRALLSSLLRLRRSPFLTGSGMTALRYLKPGFHPDDIDTNALLDEWRQKLFGADGSLVDHLK